MPDCLAAVVEENGEVRAGSSEAPVAWWSFTKTLIAAGTLLLAEQGRISLDDPLAGRSWTIRQLLQHRAGLGDYGGLAAYRHAVAEGGTPWTDEYLLGQVSLDHLLYPPGNGWAYSNVGYLLLRRLIEQNFGAGLQTVLRCLLFEPLSLSNCRLAQSEADMRALALAPPYRYHPDWTFHGCVIGPVAEAARALHGVLGRGLLGAASRRALLEAIEVDGTPAGRPWRTCRYGLGLMTGVMSAPDGAGATEVAGHSAGGPGSIGAVYCRMQGGSRRTVAVFTSDTNDGRAEHEAYRLLQPG